MNKDGAILGKAGEYLEEKSLGAIMVNVWADYYEIGREVLKQKDMDCIYVNTANSRVLARKVGNYVLLLKSDKDTDVGILKAKADVLRDLLEDQVGKIEPPQKKEDAPAQ